jgi:hypothetical protein
MEREFGKSIVLGDRPGRIWINGQELKNPVKSPRIPAEVLDDLDFLAMEAFGGSSDSTDDGSVVEVSEKYPNEQPKEVWRREIANLARQGITARDIARALFLRNERLLASRNLGSLPREGEEKVINVIREKVLSNWPSAKE